MNSKHLSFRSQTHDLAEKIIEMIYIRQPEIWKPSGDPMREKSVRDAEYHLNFLAEAVDANAPALFSEYLGWVKVLFTSLKLRDDTLEVTLECTRQVLVDELSVEARAHALEILDIAVKNLDGFGVTVPSFLEGDSPYIDMSEKFLNFLLIGDRHSASNLILEAVQGGSSVKEIYLQVFQRSLREIGRLWQINQISVAQEHFCTAATQMIISQLYPYIFTGEHKDRRLVVACVGGELHEIGARIVADFFEMSGWDTYFLGANTPLESVVRTVIEHRADVLAISVTMTLHIGKVSELISALHASGNPYKTRILVGGYPFNISPDLWMQVGADGYAVDADAAISEAEKWLQT